MSAQRIELVASATQNASGNSAAFAVPTLTMAMLGIDVTAGTYSDVDFWLEGSDDDGTTWYALAPRTRTDEVRGVTSNPSIANAAETVSSDGVYSASYPELATDKVRLAWDLVSATDITFSASLVGK